MSAADGRLLGAPRAPGVPHARQQIGPLLLLWWRHLRRRSSRVGAGPKRSGVPGFLLINLISTAYLTPLAWSAVASSVAKSEAFFAWHMLGVLLGAFGSGATKGAAALQLRGMRNDAFLEALPIAPGSVLALQLFDDFVALPLALVVPLSALHAHGRLGPGAILPALLGALGYATFFVLAHGLVAWSRALGPAATARRAAYLGVALNVVGLIAAIAPVGRMVGAARAGLTLARWWLGSPAQVGALYAGFALLLVTGYRALVAAERFGFDRLPIAHTAPKARAGVQDRIALEWQMMWRGPGKPLLVVSYLLLGFLAWELFFVARLRVALKLALYVAGLVTYLGALQTIGLAGRAARSDLMARPFLSTLPLAPHQVLDGKSRALRILLVPALATLALIGGFGAVHGDWSNAYRGALALASLYVAVDGAIGIAFLASGVGVIGVAGGRASSSFSTQLLMMPLLTTVMASSDWSATVSFLAVVAVTREARRAAKRSVRWLDDADDGVERETTVWRALLAATAFFALQILTSRLLELFEVPTGYTLAAAFSTAAIVLALLTRRNTARFEAPVFLPRRAWYWPLGALAGACSGLLALAMLRVLPAPTEAVDLPEFSAGELVAIAVTMVVIAPLAEEYFFRGWLQKAIEKDLPAPRRRWAFALGALAFALAHIGSPALPQLVLGLLAGALYASGGGLWPAVLAHAVHNGVVLLAAR